jgi:hypothetical protein
MLVFLFHHEFLDWWQNFFHFDLLELLLLARHVPDVALVYASQEDLVGQVVVSVGCRSNAPWVGHLQEAQMRFSD